MVAVERIVDRPRYLERIRPFLDVPVMKILTGVRRCGKSTLLDMLADEVVAKNPGASAVRLNLESSEGLTIRTAQALMEHLAARLPDKRARAYVFLDEVQQVPGWEDVVNGAAGRLELRPLPHRIQLDDARERTEFPPRGPVRRVPDPSPVLQGVRRAAPPARCLQRRSPGTFSSTTSSWADSQS